MDYISLIWSWMLIRLFKRKSAIRACYAIEAFSELQLPSSQVAYITQHSHRSHRIFLSKIYDKIVYEQMDQKMTWMALMYFSSLLLSEINMSIRRNFLLFLHGCNLHGLLRLPRVATAVIGPKSVIKCMSIEKWWSSYITLGADECKLLALDTVGDQVYVEFMQANDDERYYHDYNREMSSSKIKNCGHAISYLYNKIQFYNIILKQLLCFNGK